MTNKTPSENVPFNLGKFPQIDDNTFLWESFPSDFEDQVDYEAETQEYFKPNRK